MQLEKAINTLFETVLDREEFSPQRKILQSLLSNEPIQYLEPMLSTKVSKQATIKIIEQIDQTNIELFLSADLSTLLSPEEKLALTKKREEVAVGMKELRTKINELKDSIIRS